ncbi:MAG: FxsA family protein, partial [Zetaproteobacteria bacterium]
MWLFLILFFGPLIELYVLIRVGARIGAFSTIALCVLTAVVGGF